MIIIDLILDVIGYATARFLLPLITLGNVQVQPISSSEMGFNWLGFKRGKDGVLMFHTPMASSIGMIPWVLAVMGIVLLA